MRLTTTEHPSEHAGLLYVYPVVSRRAGGVSVGINLNPNNACNWRCVYCQVPGLVSGNAPEIDLARLERELDGFLDSVLRRGWLEEHAPEGSRALKDVAFSGNGEPTSSRQFAEAVDVVVRVLRKHDLVRKIEIVLITNGSFAHLPAVRRGLEAMRDAGGVVWFKVDRATDEGMRAMNDARTGPERARRNLEIAARACPTWIQTMMLAVDGEAPSESEIEAYLAFLERLVRDEVPLKGVLLYGLARPSYQPEAPRLSALPREWMENLADRIRSAGLPARVY